MSNTTNNVKVAIRVRPLISNEIEKGCQDVIEIIEPAQVVIKSLDKAFTFSYAFGTTSTQNEVYNKCVKHMIDQLFKGYNVTILAYGQTGSGKTYSMGTNYNGEELDMGVIPKAVNDIFTFIKDNFTMDINVTCSFVELYNEVLYDLLSEKSRDNRILDIREDTSKGFHIPGITEVPVSNSTEVLTALAKGSIGRATGQTNMNTQSSRSHAIFTINIFMQNKNNKDENKMAKLHLVDLAGSERPKKTGAVGNTFKEGVNINKGLFVLGNVISSLGDENKQQNNFVPYRDSNLTKLLKDSLGGNSYTLMIACISPADYNTEETLSTLRYADKALKIKNKPVVNQDAKTAEINALKKTIQQLKLQLVGQGDPMICPAEIELLKKEVNELRIKNHNLTIKLSTSLQNNTVYIERILALQNVIENSNKKILELREQYNSTINNITLNMDENESVNFKNYVNDLAGIKDQLESITNEQKLVETEIKQQERIVFKNLVSNKTVEGSQNGNEEEVPQEIHEKQESHATKQINLNLEIQAISNELCMKQHLAEQIAKNSAYMVDYNAIAENEAKVDALQKEKDELLQQLKNLQHDKKSNNLAEQRRKRVQELEGQINGLKKKLQEQSKLIQMKEKDLQKVNILNKEIAQLKQVRVKLLKTMQEDSLNFNKWKKQREQELQRLKNEGRKRENAMAKMKVMHQKQQNVLKRKVEQAVAANKRLQESLALRTKVQEARNNSGNVTKLGDMLKGEFEFRLNIVEAKAALNDILEERADLQHQLNELKKNPESEDNVESVKNLEQQIELRTLQIQDLQQKIIDSDEDKSKFKFDNIQSMSEAKFALKLIFDQAVDRFKHELTKNMKLSELEDVNVDLNKKIDRLNENLKELQEKHSAELADIKKDYEDKISILLTELRGIKNIGESGADEKLKEICNIQQEKIDKMEEENKLLQENIEQLKAQLEFVQNLSEKKNSSDSQEDCLTPINVPKKEKKDVPKVKVQLIDDIDDDFKENDEDFDDDPNDPDWHKTPLAKRIREEKRSLYYSNLTERTGIKRSSEGGCTCKTNCNNRCGCKKLGRACTSSCKCNSSTCLNTSNLESDNLTTSEEDSFKKPRLDVQSSLSSSPKKTARRTRQIFTHKT